MKNLQWWLMKIYRLSALVLLLAVIMYIVSGYGLTKGLIDKQSARWLHLDFLPAVIALAFTGHVSLAVRTTLMRWKMWNKITAAVLFVVFGMLFSGFVYIEYFYAETGFKAEIRQNEDVKATNNTASANQMKIFTAEELAKYNGLNGMPAYSAIDGVVYDLSAVFKDGMHNNNAAGIDNTNAFYSKHMKQILSKHPVVGKTSSTTF